MMDKKQEIYEFGSFLLNIAEQRLSRHGTPIHLKPKVFELLTIFVQNDGQILTKDELLRWLWADRFVEEHNITVSVSELRQALGENRNEPLYIETIPRRGYRFIAKVKRIEATGFHHAAAAGVSTRENSANSDNNQSSKSTPFNYLSPDKHSLKYLYIPALILIAVIGGFGLVKIYQTGKGNLNVFQKSQIAQITSTGNIKSAAISPNGNYIAYSTEDKAKQSIWIKQISSGNSIEILPPTENVLWGLTFSRDGNYIYYLKSSPDNGNTLYKLPILGGVGKAVLGDLSSPITFSPDGKKFAFIRRSANTQLIVANADGTGEQILAARGTPNFFTISGPSWSPDGQIIALVSGTESSKQLTFKLVGINVNDGTERPLTSDNFYKCSSVTWLADGKGFLTTAEYVGPTAPSAEASRQIWFVPYPEGAPTKLTNDFIDYTKISAADDSRTLITIQFDIRSHIYFNDAEKPIEAAREISFGSYEGFTGVSISPGGKIVYSSRVGSEIDVWMGDVSGTNKKRLTDNHQSFFPAISPDEKSIAYVSAQGGTPHIWRMDADGSNPRQLTNGGYEMVPQFSPDGKFIVYMGHDGEGMKIFKLALEGGEPVRLSDNGAMQPTVSPDGKSVAYFYREDQPKPVWRIRIISFETGEPVKTLDLPSSINPFYLAEPLRWSPNGQSLTYITTNAGVSNIFELPLNNSGNKQITNFSEQNIFGYEWSRNGRNLVFARGTSITDIVMIKLKKSGE